MSSEELPPIAILSAVVLLFLWADGRLFARDREPTFREGVVWSIGWLVVGLSAALVVWVWKGEDDAVLYTTVYLVERSLSLASLGVHPREVDCLMMARMQRVGIRNGARHQRVRGWPIVAPPGDDR